MGPNVAAVAADGNWVRRGFQQRHGPSWPGAVLVLAGHAALLLALWQLDPTNSLPNSEPMFLRLISEPVSEEPPPRLRPQTQPKARTQALPTPLPIASEVADATDVEPTSVPTGDAVSPGLTFAKNPTADAPAISEPRFDAAYLRNPAPIYPALSRRALEQGRVLLRVHVGVDGRPLDISVQQSSGYPRLDTAAVNAVRQWQFEPARRGSEAIAAYVIVPIDFQLTQNRS